MSKPTAYVATVHDHAARQTYVIGFYAESRALAWDHAQHATRDAKPSATVARVERRDMDPAAMGEFIAA